MNKTKTVFLLVFFISLVSCSSNDDDKVDEIVEEAPSVITLNVNGTEIYNGAATVYKTEDNFLLKVGDSWRCRFDKSGRFASFKIEVPTGGPSNTSKPFGSFKYFPSHYFTFNLESIDTEHKRIKGSYGGYLYNNNTNLNSESKYVNGNFDLSYFELVPGVFGLKNQCKINGNQWRDITSEAYSYTADATQTYHADNEYHVAITYRHYSSSVGVHSFTSTDVSNNVRISRYDVLTGTYINYNTTGVFTITKYEDNSIISGNYSFTAVNPNNPSDILQVTDGEFKLINNFF